MNMRAIDFRLKVVQRKSLAGNMSLSLKTKTKKDYSAMKFLYD